MRTQYKILTIIMSAILLVLIVLVILTASNSFSDRDDIIALSATSTQMITFTPDPLLESEIVLEQTPDPEDNEESIKNIDIELVDNKFSIAYYDDTVKFEYNYAIQEIGYMALYIDEEQIECGEWSFWVDCQLLNKTPKDVTIVAYDKNGIPIWKQVFPKFICYDGRNDSTLTNIESIAGESECLIIKFSYDTQPDLYSLSKLVNLKVLSIGGCDNVDNISALSDLINLEELYLSSSINDLTPIEKLYNLETFVIGGANYLEDISPIANLLHLEVLEIQSSDITNISAVENLTNLEYLTLRGEFTDISHVYKLQNLKHLFLDGDYTDINAISGLDKLVYLVMIGEYNDIYPISKLTNLVSLSLYGNYTSITPIADLNKLYDIEFVGNFSDISVLANMEMLEELRLESDELYDISSLASLTNVHTATIYGSYDNITSLVSMQNLNYLDIRGKYENVDVLAELPLLRTLYLLGELNDVSALAESVSLSCVDIICSDDVDVTTLKDAGIYCMVTVLN